MKLTLTPLAPTTRGIYNTDVGPNSLPRRFRLLHPRAAEGFVALEKDTGGLIYTDILRSAEESLHAMQAKSGVQAPGFSGHNFGFSFDVAVEQTMQAHGWSYVELLSKLKMHGWHCHRRDGEAGYKLSEMWHFNFFGSDAPKYLGYSKLGWTAPLEHLLQDTYGADFALDAAGVQTCLAKLHMYAGPIDGLLGPLSSQGIKAFQRAWLLTVNGEADAHTQRVLAFVAAEREIV